MRDDHKLAGVWRFWAEFLFLRLDSHELFRTIGVHLLAVNTDDFYWTVGQRIIDRAKGELPPAHVARNGEVPLVRNPFQHHSGPQSLNKAYYNLHLCMTPKPY